VSTYRRILAPNPGIMTLDGTNTYVVGADEDIVVVDPGPEDSTHRAAILEAIGGGQVSAVVLTHHHIDHSEGVPSLLAELGSTPPVLAAAPGAGVTGPVDDGDAVGAGLTVVLTPGHTSDSLSLVLGDPAAPDAVLTGDTVLGRGSSIVSHPDGALGPYFASLRRLIAFGSVPVLPGHGPELPDLAVAATGYLTHREQRLEQVRAALAAGAQTPMEVVEAVYADVDRILWPAAEATVRAQLAYLASTVNPPARST
jgi:glyoxylase-like metal-dependent hydrolase (beta-lactamase superfamily II)